MTSKIFMNKVTNSREDFLQEVVNILEEQGIPFCVIGGLADNAYTEPVVSLDLDVVVVAGQIDKLVDLLNKRFKVDKQPHSINISTTSADIRLQIQTDSRYQEFITRAGYKDVLGYNLPVADIEDVLQGKIWVYSDSTRRPSKRQKDLADIMRIIETYPELISNLPESIKKVVAQ